MLEIISDIERKKFQVKSVLVEKPFCLCLLHMCRFNLNIQKDISDIIPTAVCVTLRMDHHTLRH